MPVPASVPDSLRGEPFRGSDAVRSGLLTRRQLESSTWRRLFRDVYLHSDVALTHGTRCRAAALILPSCAAISGASAAHLFGADVAGAHAPVEVTVARTQQMPRRSGIAVRYSELRSTDVVARTGVPVTTPVRTAFDLARRCRLEEGVVAVDALLQVCRLRLGAIAAYCRDGRSAWHGARRVAGVLALATPGVESPMESRLRLVLVLAGLPEPVVQHRVHDDESGTVVARLDLAYVQARLGIEYDGECHWEPGAVRRDLRRQNALRALGWSLLRFTADDVLRSPGRLVTQVHSVLSRTATPT